MAVTKSVFWVFACVILLLDRRYKFMSLDYKIVDAIAKEIIVKQYGFCYDLNKSNKSESLYLFIHYDNLMQSIRISNHKDVHDYYFDKEIVSDAIKIESLKGAIKNVCNSLRKSMLHYGFKILARQRADKAC